MRYQRDFDLALNLSAAGVFVDKGSSPIILSRFITVAAVHVLNGAVGLKTRYSVSRHAYDLSPSLGQDAHPDKLVVGQEPLSVAGRDAPQPKPNAKCDFQTH